MGGFEMSEEHKKQKAGIDVIINHLISLDVPTPPAIEYEINGQKHYMMSTNLGYYAPSIHPARNLTTEHIKGEFYLPDDQFPIQTLIEFLNECIAKGATHLYSTGNYDRDVSLSPRKLIEEPEDVWKERVEKETAARAEWQKQRVIKEAEKEKELYEYLTSKYAVK